MTGVAPITSSIMNDNSENKPTEMNTRQRMSSSRFNKVQLKTDSYIKEESTWLENLKDYFSEYCNSSGVHGVRYLGERRHFIIEKVFWTVVLIIMCYLCIILILRTYLKWQLSPVIVTFATTETPIWKVPFPAVTICPEVKSDINMLNFSDIFLKKMANLHVTPEENELFESLSLICEGISSVPFLSEFRKNASHTVNASSITKLFQISPFVTIEKGDLVWSGKELDMKDLSYTYTDQGLCYSFNKISLEELQVEVEKFLNSTSHKSKGWSMERGYLKNNRTDNFPRRTFIPGAEGGLIIHLFTNRTDIDRFCSDANDGFHIYIHHPAETPVLDAPIKLSLDQVVLIAVKPKLITVTEELKKYSPKYRKCYFSDERRLRFYSNYSQRNCLSECLVNYTIQDCGCVEFYMPGSKSYPICGPAKVECLETSRKSYLLSDSSSTVEYCNCLPTCTYIEYDIEISQSNWAWRESYLILKDLLGDKYAEISSDIDGSHISRLIVYFKDIQFLSLERQELYGTTDFISSTGGLLGLFLGFSLTSAVEILYFLTLRIICNIRRFGRKFWTGQVE